MRKTRSKTKQGVLITNGVVLEKHEYMTVNLLLSLGYDIELIPKSNQYGMHTPDIKMQNLKWEMKSPKGKGKYLIANTIQRAMKQSANAVIDLRRTKRHQTKCLLEIRQEFCKSKSIKRLKIITKDEKIIDFKK